MDKGSNIDELFVDQSTRTATIVYKDKEWDFTVRELTWKEKGDCMTAATKIDIKGKKGGNPSKIVSMDMPAYNIAYMMKAIVKAPFPVNVASFMRLDEAFGDLLVDAVVDTEDLDDDTEGNSEDMLEV